MNNALPFSTIFIELDALLDTRLATVISMFNDIPQGFLNENYYKRIIDKFNGVDPEEFKRRYDNRDKDVLKYAVVTPMIDMIGQFTKATLVNVVTSPHHYQPRVIINTYPYDLTEDEVSNIILAVKKVTDGKIDIAVVNMRYEEITIDYLKQEVSILSLYNYVQWLDIHAENGTFKTKSCPDVTLFAPAIYFKDPPKKSYSENEDPFDAMEQIAAPFIGLKLLPIEDFSLVVRPKQKT